MILEECVHLASFLQSSYDFGSLLLVNRQMHDDIHNFLKTRFIFVLFTARAEPGIIRLLQDLSRIEDIPIGSEHERFATSPGYTLRMTMVNHTLSHEQRASFSVMIIDELHQNKLTSLLTMIGVTKTEGYQLSVKPFREHSFTFDFNHNASRAELDMRREQYVLEQLEALCWDFGSIEFRGCRDVSKCRETAKRMTSPRFETQEHFLNKMDEYHRLGLQHIVAGDEQKANEVWKLAFLECRLQYQTRQFRDWSKTATATTTTGSKIGNSKVDSFLFTMCYKQVCYHIRKTLHQDTPDTESAVHAVKAAQIIPQWGRSRIKSAFQPKQRMLSKLFAWETIAYMLQQNFKSAECAFGDAQKHSPQQSRGMMTLHRKIKHKCADRAELAQWLSDFEKA